MRTRLSRLRTTAALVCVMAIAAATGASAAPVPPKPIDPKQDGLGVTLPAGLDADTLVGLVMPMGDPARVTLVGAKPWPRRADSYVVIVCAADDTARISKTPDCGPQTAGPGVTEQTLPVAYVGVVERKAGGVPTLVAASGAITLKTDWSRSMLTAPVDAEEAPDSRVLPSQWRQFDLAPYRIADDEYAFGLRGGWSESFAGGGALFNALYLFKIETNRLAVVLAEPMYANYEIAGGWNKDGTRDHSIETDENVLAITKRKTDGYYDLRITQKSDKDVEKIFQWSKREGKYLEASSKP